MLAVDELLDGVAVVIEHDEDGCQTLPHHRREFLGCQLTVRGVSILGE